MAYTLKLPPRLAKQWAVKIRDRERVEPPHVTVLRGTRARRIDLRTGDFMDAEPDSDDVPEAVLTGIQDNWELGRVAEQVGRPPSAALRANGPQMNPVVFGRALTVLHVGRNVPGEPRSLRGG
jgi:hypothetical protein